MCVSVLLARSHAPNCHMATCPLQRSPVLPACHWPQWFHINVVLREKRERHRKLMVFLGDGRIKNTHMYTQSAVQQKGVEGPVFVIFTFPYSQFAKSARHEQTHSHVDSWLRCYFIWSHFLMCFKFKSTKAANTPQLFIAAQSAIFAGNFKF